MRRYVGTGPAAEAEAAAIDRRRPERETATREFEEEQARLREAESYVLALCGLADLLARASLVAAGYHEHRGQWRQRHGRPGQDDSGAGAAG
ncbi:MAG TPA: hypothetical protein VG013_15075 [Gemmataceae bacterium]|nr:hypothetical protein [Gemmataceae bacterium]